jgi:uncharacterized RDD family membrane protein YckC
MQVQNAGLGRRLGAALYDSLLVIALMGFGTVPTLIIRGGEAIDPGNVNYQLILLAIAWLFFAMFWSRYGRTLGLQSWRMRIEMFDGSKPTFVAASIRFFAAILSWLPAGLGFWWALWDKDKLAWHDRLSRTRLRYYPKQLPSK